MGFSPEMQAAYLATGVVLASGILAWMFSVNEKLTRIAASVGFLAENIKKHDERLSRLEDA